MNIESIFKLSPIILILFFLTNNVSAQKLDLSDFKVGPLELKLPLDSVITIYGETEKIKDLGYEFEGFKSYEYEKFMIFINEENQEIWTFEIYDSSFETKRGIRIGDSKAKIDSLYEGSRFRSKKFGRVGPYDYSFKAYTNYSVIHHYERGWFIIFYYNEGKLVRMLFYIGIRE